MLKRVLLSCVALLAIAAAATGLSGSARAQSTVTLTDTITREWTGVTGTSYQLWEDVVSPATDAVYAGCSAGGNNAIQMRSTIAIPGASGIVTTTSGGKVASVTVVWNSNTANNRTLQVYGKNSAYSAASDLYGGNAGTLLGTIVKGTSTSLTIEGDYEYIGLRSQQSAMYLDEIRIEWIVPQQGGSSQPALYTVTLVDTVDAEHWSITPAAAATDGVAEGTVVNIGYTGDRKVKSVVATYVPAAPAVTSVDLSTLTGNYEAQDGDVLTGTLGGNYKISIADGATVTLSNATINGANNSSYQWAGINCVGDATIILSGSNSVRGFYDEWPGIHVPSGKTVTIQGDGSLTASSNGWATGIGGGYNIDCGNITIAGGTVTATGGHAAGIGGGTQSTVGNILITGGTVTATGNMSGAGIGSSYGGTCGTITITSGVTSVTATKGGSAPNSIGAGDGGSCGTVTIEDGANVTQN